MLYRFYNLFILVTTPFSLCKEQGGHKIYCGYGGFLYIGLPYLALASLLPTSAAVFIIMDGSLAREKCY